MIEVLLLFLLVMIYNSTFRANLSITHLGPNYCGDRTGKPIIKYSKNVREESVSARQMYPTGARSPAEGSSLKVPVLTVPFCSNLQ